MEIIGILPCRMGVDFVDLVKSMNLDPSECTKTLSELIDKKYVDATEDGQFVLTEKGQELASKKDDEIKEAVSNFGLKKTTKKIIEDIVWDTKKRRIHPALHFDDNVAYTITYLNTKTKIIEDKIEKIIEVETPFIVTSDKDLIRADNPPEDIVLLHQPILPKGNDFLIRESTIPKFPSQKAVKHFIENKANVTFQEIFKEVRDKFEFFMDYDEKRFYSFCAVWSLGTFFHHLFSSYPYLFLNAVKGGGKSKNICCLAYCSFCPEIVVEPSVASLFRTIQAERCSFFLDEVEKIAIRKDNSEVRTLLLSGYKKGAGISRTKEVENKKLKAFESVTFDIYSPKAMGNIKGLEDIMESRCINVNLKKTMDSSITGRELPDEMYDPMFKVLRERLFYNQMLNWKEVRKNYKLLREILQKNEVIDGFDVKDIENIKINLIGRNWELWHPLLAISLSISKEIFQEILSLAIDLTQLRIGDEVAENYESTVVRVLCQEVNSTDWYPTSVLAGRLKEIEGLEHITSRSLTNLLKRIGLKSNKYPNKKMGNKHYVFINLDTLKDCAKRMDMDYDEIRIEDLKHEPVPKKEKLMNIINELERKYVDGIPRWEIIHSARLFFKEDILTEILEKMKTEGILYSPRPNVFSIVKSDKQVKLDEIDDENDDLDEETDEK